MSESVRPCASLNRHFKFINGSIVPLLTSWIVVLHHYEQKKAVFSHADFQILLSDSQFPIDLQQILSTINFEKHCVDTDSFRGGARE